jgi:hypothetical protein
MLLPLALTTRGVDDAVIQFSLLRPADSVKVEILDPTGQVIRTFTGGGPAAGPDSARRDSVRAPADTILSPPGCETSRRRRGPPRPTGAIGLNHFTWDLRYPGATTFDCLILWGGSAEQGPLAVPGRYQVRVTAEGVSETQPLVLRMDPRLNGVTVADLREQFDLATRIRDQVSAADSAVLRIRRLRSGIAARVAASSSPDVRRQGDAADRALRAMEDTLYQFRSRSGQDPLNFPIRINNRLAALGRSVASGDARPTAAAYAVLKELSAELETDFRQLDRVVAGEVAAFDRVAADAGRLPLVP